jgi:hypothetical protein
VKVRDSERKIKATGRLWIDFGDHPHRYNVFDFTMSRKRDGPSRFLEGFRGYLQADAFSGYDGIYAGGDVVEVGCNAHARRKFVEAQKTDMARAAAAPAYYSQLYAIEKEIKAELAKLPEDADEPTRAAIRLRVRQERAIPVWESFETWLEAERPQVLPKSYRPYPRSVWPSFFPTAGRPPRWPMLQRTRVLPRRPRSGAEQSLSADPIRGPGEAHRCVRPQGRRRLGPLRVADGSSHLATIGYSVRS